MLLLCDIGADLPDRNVDGCTAVMIAAQTRHLEVVRLLRDAEADLSGRRLVGTTVLMAVAIEELLDFMLGRMCLTEMITVRRP